MTSGRVFISTHEGMNNWLTGSLTWHEPHLPCTWSETPTFNYWMKNGIFMQLMYFETMLEDSLWPCELIPLVSFIDGHYYHHPFCSSLLIYSSIASFSDDLEKLQVDNDRHVTPSLLKVYVFSWENGCVQQITCLEISSKVLLRSSIYL